MPLPTPNPDEEKDEFIQRCMANDTMNDDFPDQSQRRAVCESQWDEGAESSGTVEPVTRYEHVVQAVFNQPWAILPSVYATICEVVRLRAQGKSFTAEEIQDRIGAASSRRSDGRMGAVAVLPLFGILAQRMNLMTAMSGGTSTEQFTRVFQTALADPEVASIVIDVDSPGGSVYGVQELWQSIFDARGQKPIIAQANTLMASAAYWVASAADEIVVTPSGELGSIGVIAEHQDISGAMEKDGIKPTLITAGKKKSQGNPYEALNDESRADIQAKVDAYYNMFVTSVARGRGVRSSEVRRGFGEGGTVLANEAVSLGLANRVATLEQTIQRLSRQRSSRGQQRAELAEDISLSVSAETNNDGLDREALELRSRRLKILR